MGSGASDLSQVALEEVIETVRKVSPASRLSGEEIESLVGLNFFDPNDYDAIATYDEQTDMHNVRQEDLLKILIAQKVESNPDSEAATINEYEEQEEARKYRNEVLSRLRPMGDISDLRGAVWPQDNAPLITYDPIPPADADSRTKIYPHAGAMIFIVQLRPEGGWNIGLFRNSKTGEWGAITANYNERHSLSQSRMNALRACAAEALNEQTCGLLHCSSRNISNILRDDCSVSVAYDGGEDLDEDGKTRPLMQIFMIRVEGFNSQDLKNNRNIILENIGCQLPKRQWLEIDDVTFVAVESFYKKSLNGIVADVNGYTCTCRRLINILSRKVVSFTDVENKVNTTSNGTNPSSCQVLSDLLMKLETILLEKEIKKFNKKKSFKKVDFSYFEKRWFARYEKSELDLEEDKKLSQDELIELTQHPDIGSCGGLLAGGFTASITSTDSILYRPRG